MKDINEEPLFVPDPQKVAAIASLPEQEFRVKVIEYFLTLEHRVDDNTEITADTQQEVKRDLAAIKTILQTVEAGLTFLGGMGKVAKWFAYIAVAFTAGVGALKAGENIPQIIRDITDAWLKMDMP